ncbi:MAG: hypothetical protein Q7S09_00755 [bacterium]|nr:hypothetical protein [bacterium]
MAGWSGIYTNDQEVARSLIRQLTEMGLVIESRASTDPSISLWKNGVWFWLDLPGYFHPLSKKLFELARDIMQPREKQEVYISPKDLQSQNADKSQEGAGAVLVYQAANNTTESGFYVEFADGAETEAHFFENPEDKCSDGSNEIAAEYFLKRHNLEIHTDFPDNWRVVEDYELTEKALQEVEREHSSIPAAR